MSKLPKPKLIASGMVHFPATGRCGCCRVRIDKPSMPQAIEHRGQTVLFLVCEECLKKSPAEVLPALIDRLWDADMDIEAGESKLREGFRAVDAEYWKR